MTEQAQGRDESDIRAAWMGGSFDVATGLTLQRYGPEVYSFLVGVHRDHDDADDAYSMFSERLWTTMPRFRFHCSMRTWVYLLARNASTEVRRGVAKGYALSLDSAEGTHFAQLAQKVRTETLTLLRTEKRTALQELCLTLSEADRELLILRLTRDMSWREVALVLAGNTEPLDEHALGQESARIRKRFQLLRARLRELGKARGLL